MVFWKKYLLILIECGMKMLFTPIPNFFFLFTPLNIHETWNAAWMGWHVTRPNVWAAYTIHNAVDRRLSAGIIESVTYNVVHLMIVKFSNTRLFLKIIFNSLIKFMGFSLLYICTICDAFQHSVTVVCLDRYRVYVKLYTSPLKSFSNRLVSSSEINILWSRAGWIMKKVIHG